MVKRNMSRVVPNKGKRRKVEKIYIYKKREKKEKKK